MFRHSTVHLLSLLRSIPLYGYSTSHKSLSSCLWCLSCVQVSLFKQCRYKDTCQQVLPFTFEFSTTHQKLIFPNDMRFKLNVFYLWRTNSLTAHYWPFCHDPVSLQRLLAPLAFTQGNVWESVVCNGAVGARRRRKRGRWIRSLRSWVSEPTTHLVQPPPARSVFQADLQTRQTEDRLCHGKTSGRALGLEFRSTLPIRTYCSLSRHNITSMFTTIFSEFW